MNTSRPTLVILFLFACSSVFAQERALYFTYDGKPAVRDSAQRIRKGVLENGKWHVLEYENFLSAPRSESWYLDSSFLIADGDYTAFSYNDSTKISDRGQYAKGKKTGLWISFDDSGAPLDSSMYADDHISFHRVYYPGGKPREIVAIGADGSGSSTGYWDDGRPEHSGQFSQWKKTGPWSYYSRQGVLCTVETMQADTIASAVDYDAMGKNPKPHKGDYEIESDYPGGASSWMAYLSKSMPEKKLPKAFLEGKTPQGTVVIMFTVDEKGNVGEIKVQHSVYPSLDALASEIVRKSGHWIPGIQHNRLVKTYKRQPFTFKLVD